MTGRPWATLVELTEHVVHLATLSGVCQPFKLPILQLKRSCPDSAPADQGKRSADANAPDAEISQLCEAYSWTPNEHIDRLGRQSLSHRRDILLLPGHANTRSIETIRSSIRKRDKFVDSRIYRALI